MRDYGKVSPRFWTGPTGKAIRSLGSEAQVIALYLLTCPSSTMSGLYYLPLPVLVHETGIPLEGALEVLRSLSEADFAHYDDAMEVVWLPEMARHQIGDHLVTKDKRHVGLLRELAQHSKCAFVKDFWVRYHVAYNLPIPSPFEGPSKPLRSQEQEQEKEQEQEQEQEQTPAPSPSSVDAHAPPLRSLDPAKPFRMTATWDPGGAVLAGSAVPNWAHQPLLARFRSHHVNGEAARTEGQWRQSYVRWANRDWQDPKARPVKPDPDEPIAATESPEERQARLRAEFERGRVSA